MKHFLFFISSMMIILCLIACDSCPGEDETCPYGVWDDNNCHCTCEYNTCDHGVWDEDNCTCDCYDDYSGYHCETYSPTNDYSAQISIDGGSVFHYFPQTFDFHLNSGDMADSLWIDAYNENGTGDADDYYVFIYAIVPDITNITDTMTVPITGNYTVNQCWASMQDPNYPGFFANGNNGTLSLNNVYEQPAGSGSYMVEATFDYSLFNGTNTVHIVGYCEGVVSP